MVAAVLTIIGFFLNEGGPSSTAFEKI